jgi:predicted  nucleic acid-binding Zn-ribbon protein
MNDPRLWSIAAVSLGIIVTAIASLVAILSFIHHRRQALSFLEHLKGLPDKVEREFLIKENEKLQEEYERLKDVLLDAEQTLAAASKERQWMEDTRAEIKGLEQDKLEVLRIQNELETAQGHLASMHAEKSRLDGDIADRKMKLDDLEQEISKSRKELVGLELEVAHAERLRQEIKTLETEKGSLAQQNEQMRIAASELKSRLEGELTQLQRQRAQVQSEFDTLSLAVESKAKERDHLEASVSQLKDTLTSLRAEERTLKEALHEMELQKRKADQLTKDVAALENQRKNTQAQIETLDQKLEDLKRRNKETQAEAAKIKEQRDEYEQERAALERERRRLKAEVEKYESRSNALSAALPVMESAIRDLSSAVNQHDGAASPEESELWHPVIPVTYELESEARTEAECLEDLHSCLRSQGLRFDLRMLYAFHTSLKTTDSSPLVTLAGVSGTGKSELPRRYAEAVGMNFLNVAVQPRWDSPQDLFGFYDYLERRFRPTDLTRALIQMDPIGPEEGRGWNPPANHQTQRLSNQLLLVLLDEMNLARIEYYFSEFLSRLETRRGIEPRVAEKRKLAEISLDIGGRRNGQPPMQLFVDRNVLFVGTMNEDETTQSLSDKVIDRSNVLRFGSPKSVAPVPASQRNGKSFNDSFKLTREMWEEWGRKADDLEDSDRHQILEWIGALHEAMKQVNRPFAYRVSQSILEYAANYPDVDRRLDFAISDQIEQKILPKLMGLNPQEPKTKSTLDVIDRILDEVNDEALSRQITSCRDDDYFHWTGLDRSEV